MGTEREKGFSSASTTSVKLIYSRSAVGTVTLCLCAVSPNKGHCLLFRLFFCFFLKGLQEVKRCKSVSLNNASFADKSNHTHARKQAHSESDNPNHTSLWNVLSSATSNVFKSSN